ncbi:MAG: hypothetical protein R3C49_02310 [Planctomycetaceae bacterium]
MIVAVKPHISITPNRTMDLCHLHVGSFYRASYDLQHPAMAFVRITPSFEGRSAGFFAVICSRP